MLNIAIDFKEQMAEARRTQILMGAAQIFSKKGYHRATTREIAEAADVSEGTIYHYFDNKRKLLIAMMELLGRWSLEGIIRENPPDDPKDFLTTLHQDLYQLLEERGEFAVPILAEIFTDTELRETLYQQLVQPIAAYVEKFLETQAPSSSLRRKDPIIIAYALLGAMLLNFMLKATNLDPHYSQISAKAMIEQTVSLFLDNLRANKELAWFVS